MFQLVWFGFSPLVERLFLSIALGDFADENSENSVDYYLVLVTS